ncbi:hypothetical protein P152DRAFT_515475 [Eremomyces bilateralis CBS 781.70]|uniref:Uncharacterized protein n=1 Tax=Eremomyces bilateralis CBS 781.70 TaxID=1392243 RepID=A0A6G1FZ54_9PEZI|nr:uncharacterized protein P152DRAFT_515475 [Eremomyces bilateralis CBS 781.70]KAF1811073.1 hypothetical protein P152DRAFT_515475 [Eremomyces bilateralis CBS 781.70]
MSLANYAFMQQYLRVSEELTWVIRTTSHCLSLWKFCDYLDYNAFRQCYNELNYAIEHLDHLRHNFPYLFAEHSGRYANCEPLFIQLRGKVEALLTMFYKHPQDGIYNVPDLHPGLVRTNFWMLKDAWKTASDALEHDARWLLPVMMTQDLLKRVLPQQANQGEVLQTVASMSINRLWAPELHKLPLEDRLQATWRDDSFVNNRCIMVFHWNNRKFLGGQCDDTWQWVCFRNPDDDEPMLHLKYPAETGGITEPLNELPVNRAWGQHIDQKDWMRIEFPDPYYWEPMQRRGESGAFIP